MPPQKFYSSICQLYNHIFPLNNQQVVFTQKFLPVKGNVVEIGCATGNLIEKLSENRHLNVLGIDYDEEMADFASERFIAVENVDVKHLDMKEMSTLSPSLSTVICYGNTFVHLKTTEDMSKVVSQIYRMLHPDGTLLLQIINYDRILDRKLTSLPVIDNNFVKFEREYDLSSSGESIIFKTEILDKSTGKTVRNRIPLFPLRKKQLEGILTDAGFSVVDYFGSFNGEIFEEASSYHLIAAARKHP